MSEGTTSWLQVKWEKSESQMDRIDPAPMSIRDTRQCLAVDFPHIGNESYAIISGVICDVSTGRRRKRVEQKRDEELEYFVVSMQLVRGMLNARTQLYAYTCTQTHTARRSMIPLRSFVGHSIQGTHANSNSCVFFHVGVFFSLDNALKGSRIHMPVAREPSSHFFSPLFSPSPLEQFIFILHLSA